MSSPGVGDGWSTVFHQVQSLHSVYQKHSMLPPADKLFRDINLLFQQDLTPAHSAKAARKWFAYNVIIVLDGLVNLSDLNPPRESLGQ